MKRILTLCAQPLFAARGSPIRVKAFLRALGNKGFRVDVVTLPFGEEVVLPPSIRLFRVCNFIFAKTVRIGPSVAKFFLGALVALRAFFFALVRPYSTVHGIEEMGLPAWFIARLTRSRFVYEKHSDPDSYRSESRFKNCVIAVYARVEKFVCRRADVVVVTGPGLAKQVAGYGTKAVIRTILDVASSDKEGRSERISHWRERFGCEPNDVVVAYIGSFAEYQGVPLLRDAANRILSCGGNLRFVFVGGSSEERAEMKKEVEQSSCGGRLVQIDRIDPEEVPDFLLACDVLVSPRLHGSNSPLKVLDYLRSGRCILATDTAANRLVLDAQVALLTEPSAEGLEQGIVKLAADADLRAKLGRNGRILFEKRFGFDRFRDDLIKVFL